MPPNNDLPNQDLRTLRLGVRMPFRELATALSIEETELRRIERGLSTPSSAVFRKAAKLLNAKAEDIEAAHQRLSAQAVPGEGYVTAVPEATFVRQAREELDGGSIPILDLFCGTGGFSHGFEQTGAFQVSCGIDLLPDRVETFAANHPTAKAVCGDIRSTTYEALLADCKAPEVVIGGPPCQGFSSIRPFRTLTETDPRNHLFENFALVVRETRPRWFVMENVVGMLTNQQGAVLSAVLAIFNELKYKTTWRVLNAALYGLPQRRERLVLVGSRDGEDFEWPQPTHRLDGLRSMAGKYGQRSDTADLFESRKPQPALTVMEAIHDLPEIKAGETSDQYRDDVEPTDYERKLRGRCKVLTLHEATAHSENMLHIIRHAGFNKSALPKGMVSSGFSTCYSRLEPDLPAVTMTVNFVHPASNKCIHPHQDRALTPREGARLQGFPDSFSFFGSRAQVVKQIGNAVPPLLGRVIAEALLPYFKRKGSRERLEAASAR